jgi:hypothetical protein
LRRRFVIGGKLFLFLEYYHHSQKVPVIDCSRAIHRAAMRSTPRQQVHDSNLRKMPAESRQLQSAAFLKPLNKDAINGFWDLQSMF